MTSWLYMGVIGLALLASTPAAPSTVGPEARQQAMVGGSDLFRSYCKACHGESGRGDGPLASALKKRTADLTGLTQRNNGTFPTEMVAQIIDGRNPVKGHGGGDMPVWGDALLNSQGSGTEVLVKDRIMALVEHLRTLQK